MQIAGVAIHTTRAFACCSFHLHWTEHAARNNKPADNSSFASASPPSSNTSASNSSLASSSASTDEVAAAENVFDVLIFKAADVVYLKAKDVDLDYGEFAAAHVVEEL